jgi:phosphoglycolate phosphatase
MKFILFDIDGTLLDSGGAGIMSLNMAFEEIFAVRDAFGSVNPAGKTDMQILKEGFLLHNINFSNGLISEFYGSYTGHLKRNITKTKGHVKPGIREALRELQVRDTEYILGLLTGNIEEGAWIKLAAFGLDPYFRIGAFGNDDEDRNRLLPVAVEKLHRQRSLKVSFRDCVVIGDTPLDISCSKPHGAFSVAVATGPYSAEVLSLAGADVVFNDISDTDAFLASIEAA